MENPLLEPLLHLLRQGGPHKLHELMSQLRTGGYLPQWPVEAQQQLFRTNFLLMNGLYQLQSRLLTEGAWLAISPLALQILPLEAGEPAVALTDPLREYYLDWQIFWQTDAAEVEVLLKAFWQRYCGEQQGEARRRALAELGLPQDASPAQIKRRWKALALTHHPDRRGDAARFVAINLAWEQLCQNAPVAARDRD